MMMEALRIYREAMREFVTQKLQDVYGDQLWWQQGVARLFKAEEMGRLEEIFESRTTRLSAVDPKVTEMADMLDISHFRQIIDANWRQVFGQFLKDKSVVGAWIGEVTNARNALAHWTAGDVERPAALRFIDTCQRVVATFDPQRAEEIRTIWDTVDREGKPKRTRRRQEDQTADVAPDESGTTTSAGRQRRSGLRPWREVIAPHPDVASGRYAQAEFAADLTQVVQGTAGPDTQDPLEFFERTYVTAGMEGLLRSALNRLSGKGRDPVIQLKTAFGGGKTHTLLALYHLLSKDRRLLSLESVGTVLAGVGLDAPPEAVRAVLVGTDLDPNKGNPKEVGIETHTLWGEMAWQLGGLEGFRLVDDADAGGIAPGGRTLDQLFSKVGPCVVLIDELVAYVRNIGHKQGLSGGTLDSNMTFIQNLTESVKRNPQAVLVAAIPESNIEVGGPSGMEVLQRIENTFGRLEAVWKPVDAHESFEVVRRRLFSEVQDASARDATCAAFARLYRDNRSDFPVECREVAYERRMGGSYPIHPEVFDRLYDDWSTMERFQRTRGVLRLMAAVIHRLWESGDASPLIMPGSLPLYAPRVREELLRYLTDQWNAVLDEADGDDSETARVDNENQRFGQFQAARKLARSVFMGSIPSKATRGIEDVRILLGVVEPGQPISTYNDGLGRLQQRLQFLYTSGQGRYWFDVQPNLTRTVADRSSRISDADVLHHLEERLEKARTGRDKFAGIHVCPESTDDVPDEPAARLVVLSPRHAHKRGTSDSAAVATAADTLQNRGNSPRRYRNMLVFAAADQDAVQTLIDETRRYLAWVSIQREATALNLDRTQEQQVTESVESGDKTITVQLDAAYQWAFIPRQEGTGPQDWEIVSLRGGDLGSIGGLVQRVSNRLQGQELLILEWSPVHLRRELDQYLWKDDRPHIDVKQLWDYMATYPYLSRLRDKDVLLATIRAGVYSKDYFGYATGVTDDEEYTGLVFGSPPPGVYFDDASVVVRPEVAEEQVNKGEPARPVGQPSTEGEAAEVTQGGDGTTSTPERPVNPRRFYATARLNPLRMSSDAGTIGQEVIQHIQALLDSNIEVTLEITAESQQGFPDNVVRTVTENARTLKFENFGFEEQ